MSLNSPSGSKSDPLYTENAPLSIGTAIVIATAGSAVILSQVVLRTWRHVSLAQGQGLLLGRIHLLVLILLAVSAVAGAGAFRYFKDDARAMGGLFSGVWRVCALRIPSPAAPDENRNRAANAHALLELAQVVRCPNTVPPPWNCMRLSLCLGDGSGTIVGHAGAHVFNRRRVRHAFGPSGVSRVEWDGAAMAMGSPPSVPSAYARMALRCWSH